MVACPPDLRAAYREGRVLPFVGAGVSASVSWEEGGRQVTPPTWSDLVDKAAELLGFTDPSLLRVRGSDLQTLEFFDLMRGRDELVNWLVRATEPPDEVLTESPIHAALASLNACRTIYTTNYDNFIERALQLHGRAVVRLAHEKDFPDSLKVRLAPSGADACEIVKFHGDFDVRDRLVLTEADYQDRLQLVSEMDLRLRSDLLGRAVLFIGYSFRDPNVSYLFKLVNDRFRDLPGSPHGNRAYIAIPDPSLFERKLFKERRIEVISLGSDRITEDTAELLTEVQA